jgi:hypothetical protein
MTFESYCSIQLFCREGTSGIGVEYWFSNAISLEFETGWFQYGSFSMPFKPSPMIKAKLCQCVNVFNS